ncbi:MAG: 30S ribosomal protein S20 [Candidatus Omnitrophica bacterium]|nr:30S ribosomal protein S20 [Candidatus Omnitrophota bacterium]
MPIIHAAEKRVRADRKRRQRNLQVQSELKTLEKKLHGLIQSRDASGAGDLLKILTKRLDQAASKKVLHRNTASRNKARWSRQLANLSSS